MKNPVLTGKIVFLNESHMMCTLEKLIQIYKFKILFDIVIASLYLLSYLYKFVEEIYSDATSE